MYLFIWEMIHHLLPLIFFFSPFSGNETFEKLGGGGTIANLVIYLTKVFNMKSITAANILNIFNGTTNFSTLLGAFFCDTYFGRYKTLAFCTIASYMV